MNNSWGPSDFYQMQANVMGMPQQQMMPNQMPMADNFPSGNHVMQMQGDHGGNEGSYRNARNNRDKNKGDRERDRSQQRHEYERNDHNNRNNDGHYRNRRDRASKWDREDRPALLPLPPMPSAPLLPGPMEPGSMGAGPLLPSPLPTTGPGNMGITGMMPQYSNMNMNTMMGQSMDMGNIGNMPNMMPSMQGMMQGMPNMMDQNMMMMNMHNMQMMVMQQSLCVGNVTLLPPLPGTTLPNRRERPENCRTIFVGGLPSGVSEDIIQEIFGKFGKVCHVKETRQGVYHVRFENPESMEQTFMLSGYRFKYNNQMDNEAMAIFIDYALGQADRIGSSSAHSKFTMLRNELLGIPNNRVEDLRVRTPWRIGSPEDELQFISLMEHNRPQQNVPEEKLKAAKAGVGRKSTEPTRSCSCSTKSSVLTQVKNPIKGETKIPVKTGYSPPVAEPAPAESSQPVARLVQKHGSPRTEVNHLKLDKKPKRYRRGKKQRRPLAFKQRLDERNVNKPIPKDVYIEPHPSARGDQRKFGEDRKHQGLFSDSDGFEANSTGIPETGRLDKCQSHWDEYKKWKLSNKHKLSSYADATKSDNKVVVTATPSGYINAASAELIKEKLQQKLVASMLAEKNGEGPVFLGKPIYNGSVLKVWCSNFSTMLWLKSAVQDIILPSGEKLVVKQKWEILRLVRCSILLPGDWKDTETIGNMLHFQNIWAEVNRWVLYAIYHHNNNTFIKVSVPEDVVPAVMAHERRLAFMLGSVYLMFQTSGGKLTVTPPLTAKTARSPQRVIQAETLLSPNRWTLESLSGSSMDLDDYESTSSGSDVVCLDDLDIKEDEIQR